MENPCVHCGTDCGKSPVVWEDKNFCCHGCKTVYQILNENSLGAYYEIQPMSGIRIETGQALKKFAFLDLDEIKSKLADFRDGNIIRVKFFIPAIHCASCIWLLEHLDTLHPGISHSSVNFPRKEVSVTFRDDAISMRQLAELLASIHYVPEITLEHLDEKQLSKTGKALMLKIGVASFSFMNIMMYSFPEYLPGGDLLEQKFKHLFGWLSFVLILPVVFYSASDYYISAYKGLKNKIISIDLPISIGIVALFFYSSYVVFSGRGIGYMDSLAGLLFFLLIGKWYQGKTYEALSFERDYRSYFPVAITRLDEGAETIVPIRELKKGDRILIRNQELVPADALLAKGRGSIDYSFVTGEAMPVAKKINDFIYAGGRQIGSSIELVVEKAVEQSYLTQLWNQGGTKKDAESLNNHINYISQYFTIAVLVIAFASAAYWAFRDLPTAIYVFASVLIIACPCALALTVPFTFGSTMRAYGRKGFYIKNTDVVEKLHRISTVVFDKTGTITLNRKVEISYYGRELRKDELLLLAGVVRHSSHPLSLALKEYLRLETSLSPEIYEELPGLGQTAFVDGHRINIGSEAFVNGQLSETSPAESRVYVSIDGQQPGYFAFTNSYRPGLQLLIETLKKRHRLHLISGDNNSEEQRMRAIFGAEAQLHFNQSPTDKKQYIVGLKAKGENVLMIGDGLNDAGALAESNTGISIAEDVFSFSPACDAILKAEQFENLAKFVDFSHESFKVVRRSFAISLTYNLIGLSFAVSGKLSPLIAAILMPLSSISIVAFATLSIGWFAARKL